MAALLQAREPVCAEPALRPGYPINRKFCDTARNVFSCSKRGRGNLQATFELLTSYAGLVSGV